ARHHSLRRLVALKMIRMGAWTSPEQLSRFRAEARAAACLQHPNIIQIHEVGDSREGPFLAMELAEGGSLDRKLATGPLAPREAAELVELLARAMHHAHGHGILHRDLKPGNVLLTTDGTPKISDFGLAKSVSDVPESVEASRPEHQTRTGQILGTPSYMAPEQASGHKALGPATDIHALGAILYETLSGRPPFLAATILETLEQVRSREPVRLSRLQSGLPRDLQTICLKCLEKDPTRRYRSAAALGDDLRRYLDQKPIAARPANLLVRMLKWARRRPAAAALVAVSLLAVTGLVGGILAHNAVLRVQVRRAQAEEARADRNYTEARQTIQQMLARLSDKNLAETRQLKDLQRKQMEDALAFYQSLLRQLDDNDPGVRFDSAQAARETAAIQGRLGRYSKATHNVQRTIELLERLGREQPDRMELRAELADSYRMLADLQSAVSRLDLAEVGHQRAIAIYEALISDPSAPAAWHEGLARCHNNIAGVFMSTNRFEEAMDHYQQALTINQALLRADPANMRLRASASQNLINLALLGSSDDAYRRAESNVKSLTLDYPGEVEFAANLANLYGNWANLSRGQGSLERTLSLYASTIRTAKAVLDQEPNWVAAKSTLLNAHGGRAQFFDGLKRYDEALTDWDVVIKMSKGPARFQHSMSRALTLARMGAPARAVAQAEAMAEGMELAGVDLFNLACVYAVSMAALPVDAPPPVKEQYGNRAVELLEQAHASGWFRDPSAIDLVRADRDLEPIRSRSDYRSLMGHLEQAMDSVGPEPGDSKAADQAR
ncbi:MAG TPA: serine/threonine-protein kinase, partial [Pirellulaceae bacterium]